MKSSLREALKARLGPRWTTEARLLLRRKTHPRWGNFRRTSPFSAAFGFDRGKPVDRYYLEQFLGVHRQEITGQVLEIQCRGYTERFGTSVTASHTLDISPSAAPTYCCDLAACEHVVRSNRYDCFLLPNTLHHVRDLEPALRQALRIVRPGGVILASTVGFVPLIPDGPDYWRMTADGWRTLAGRAWNGHQFDIETHGNCLAAAAALYGLAAEELTPSELDVTDPRYPVLITIRCRKRQAADA